MDSSGRIHTLTPEIRQEINEIISGMAKNALRTIALAHKVIINVTGNETVDEIESNLILNSIFGIKDPLRLDVTKAIKSCQLAGIFVRMVTGDNIDTAKAIALECGILTDGGIAMEGPKFRSLTPKQLDEILPKLQVLARSSPQDKHTLVTRLNGHALPKNQEEWELLHPNANYMNDKDKLLPGYYDEWILSRVDGTGEVVGVTGDGTNDGPALKAADVGLSMGLSGTDGRFKSIDSLIILSFVWTNYHYLSNSFSIHR